MAKHNLRKYKSEEYSADNIFLIYGTDNLVQDVKAIYHKEFDEALKVYNENQSRADRKIEDYFEPVANKEQDMAVEIIIQVVILQDNLRAFANQKVKIVFGEQIREKAKGRNHDLSVMEYKVL